MSTSIISSEILLLFIWDFFPISTCLFSFGYFEVTCNEQQQQRKCLRWNVSKPAMLQIYDVRGQQCNVSQNHSNSFILELTIVTHFADLSLNVNITTMVRRYFSMRFLSVVWEKTTTTLMIHQMIYLGRDCSKRIAWPSTEEYPVIYPR